MSEGGDTTEDEVIDVEDEKFGSDLEREEKEVENDLEESKGKDDDDELEVKFEPDSELVKALEKDDSFEFEQPDIDLGDQAMPDAEDDF